MASRLSTEAPKDNAERLEPASAASRFVEAGKLKLHYLDYGTEGRPCMLCVHGGAANAHWFDYVAGDFSRDYHVLAIDLRGHGDSEWADPPSYRYEDYAADLDLAAKKLDLRDFVLIGHSMGGAVSLLYAAKYPQRVKTLIIVDSTVNLSADRIATMRNVGSRSGGTYATQEEMVARYRLRPGNSLATPEVVRHIAAHSVRQNDEGEWLYKFDRTVYATREVNDGRPNWNRIKVPTLLVKGDKSERISPEVFADVKERCPQAQLAEVSGSDHHVTLDNPRGFVSAVRAFLRK